MSIKKELARLSPWEDLIEYARPNNKEYVGISDNFKFMFDINNPTNNIIFNYNSKLILFDDKYNDINLWIKNINKYFKWLKLSKKEKLYFKKKTGSFINKLVIYDEDDNEYNVENIEVTFTYYSYEQIYRSSHYLSGVRSYPKYCLLINIKSLNNKKVNDQLSLHYNTVKELCKYLNTKYANKKISRIKKKLEKINKIFK